MGFLFSSMSVPPALLAYSFYNYKPTEAIYHLDYVYMAKSWTWIVSKYPWKCTLFTCWHDLEWLKAKSLDYINCHYYYIFFSGYFFFLRTYDRIELCRKSSSTRNYMIIAVQKCHFFPSNSFKRKLDKLWFKFVNYSYICLNIGLWYCEENKKTTCCILFDDACSNSMVGWYVTFRGNNTVLSSIFVLKKTSKNKKRNYSHCILNHEIN